MTGREDFDNVITLRWGRIERDQRKKVIEQGGEDFILSPRLPGFAYENPIAKDSSRRRSHLGSAELLRNRDWRGRIYDLARAPSQIRPYAVCKPPSLA